MKNVAILFLCFFVSVTGYSQPKGFKRISQHTIDSILKGSVVVFDSTNPPQNIPFGTNVINQKPLAFPGVDMRDVELAHAKEEGREEMRNEMTWIIVAIVGVFIGAVGVSIKNMLNNKNKKS